MAAPDGYCSHAPMATVVMSIIWRLFARSPDRFSNKGFLRRSVVCRRASLYSKGRAFCLFCGIYVITFTVVGQPQISSNCVICFCLNLRRVSVKIIPCKLQMARKRERNGLYRSSQVAKILGMSSRTLYRMLANGRIQEPMRNPENRYRLWTEVDIHAIREALHK